MGGAVSSVAKAVSKPVGSLFGGVASGAGLTVGDPGEVSVNSANFQQSQDEKDFQAELKKRYLGQGPSIAENALRSATDRNISQLYANAAAQRTNQALIQREVLRAQQQANQEAANQSAQIRAQEMNAATAAYGDIVQRPRLAAQEFEATKAGISRSNADRSLQAQTTNAQTMAGLYSGIGQAAAMSDEKLKTDIKEIKIDYPKNASTTTESEEEKSKKRSEAYGRALGDSTIAQTANFKTGKQAGEGFANIAKSISASNSASVSSDENGKKDKKQDPGKEFINALTGYTYKYKDTSKPGTKPGTQMGVMAQDLEKSEIGKQMVMDTKDGKMVDFSKAIAPMLATQATMNKEVEAIKKALAQTNKKKA